jgi:hemerythrin
MKILSILFVFFFLSCQVTNTQRMAKKQEKKYQKELSIFTKSYIKSYIKNSPNEFVKTIKSMTIVYDTIPK